MMNGQIHQCLDALHDLKSEGVNALHLLWLDVWHLGL